VTESVTDKARQDRRDLPSVTLFLPRSTGQLI
jgi:hypothetical protein